MLIYMQKITFFNFFWDIVKILQTCYFGNFGNAWPSPSKSYYQFVASFHAYLRDKINFITQNFFKDIAEK